MGTHHIVFMKNSEKYQHFWVGEKNKHVIWGCVCRWLSAVECIPLDKDFICLLIRGYIHKIFFLFPRENIYCGYSLEAPQRGTSNEYPQDVFSWGNKKNINILSVEKIVYNGVMVVSTFVFLHETLMW